MISFDLRIIFIIGRHFHLQSTSFLPPPFNFRPFHAAFGEPETRNRLKGGSETVLYPRLYSLWGIFVLEGCPSTALQGFVTFCSLTAAGPFASLGPKQVRAYKGELSQFLASLLLHSDWNCPVCVLNTSWDQ